jgi:hypothetical protein
MASSFVVPAALGEEEVVADQARGAWEGSDVTTADIEWLRLSRRIPLDVECWLRAGEPAPVVRPGEYVVFVAHFERGFGLPASNFLRNFMERFNLQLTISRQTPSPQFLLLFPSVKPISASGPPLISGPSISNSSHRLSRTGILLLEKNI